MGLGSLFETALGAAPAIIDAFQQQAIDPRGPLQNVSTFQSGGALDSILNFPGLLNLPDATGGGCGAMFRSTAPGIRPRREIRCLNPGTGNIEVWKHAGRPILYSGDASCAKRFAKLTGKKLVARGGTTTRRRRSPR